MGTRRAATTGIALLLALTACNDNAASGSKSPVAPASPSVSDTAPGGDGGGGGY